MSKKTKITTSLLMPGTLLLTICLPLTANADQTTSGFAIENAGFESDGLVYATAPTGWTWNSEGECGMTTAFYTEGSYGAYIGNGAVLTQTLDYTIPSEGTEFVFSADTINTWQGSPEIALCYEADDGTYVELGNASLPYESDSWSNYQEIECIATATADSVGKKLAVELTVANYPGNYWVDFDNLFVDNVGWVNSDIFGWYYRWNTNWIYSAVHGPMYIWRNDADSLFIYNYDFGWIWTSEEFYPYFYSYDDGTFFYYEEGTSSPREFYNFLTNEWIDDTSL
jgi:hypothetical protein